MQKKYFVVEANTRKAFEAAMNELDPKDDAELVGFSCWEGGYAGLCWKAAPRQPVINNPRPEGKTKRI
ncbi:MAG: hypothetical protein EXR72_10700 [Myxococcales bacterium]|nr:hypothetical protein [Myxococcales bacterium]